MNATQVQSIAFTNLANSAVRGGPFRVEEEGQLREETWFPRIPLEMARSSVLVRAWCRCQLWAVCHPPSWPGSHHLWTSSILAKDSSGGAETEFVGKGNDFVVSTPTMLRAQQDKVVREVQGLHGKRQGPGASTDSGQEHKVGSQAAQAIALPSNERLGPSGPEPTRYGDWERAGRCSDF